MPYLKAVVAAVLTALAIGAATGGVEVVRRAFASLPPADKAAVFAASLSEAINCAALSLTVSVPLAVILVFTVRRWRRRTSPERPG